MTDANELEALRKRVEELEAKANPPKEKPFVPQPYEPIDWTARMSMPRSAIEAMVAAEPRGFMKGVVADNRAPTSPGYSQQGSQQGAQQAGVAGGGTGWAHEVPIGPPPGIYHVDAQMIADEVRQRADLKRKLGE